MSFTLNRSWSLRALAFVVVLCSAFLGFCVPAFAQTGTVSQSPPTDLSSLLLWIATGGGAAAVVSWIAMRWVWFQAQPGDRKSLMILMSTTVMAVLAKLLIDLLPADIITTLSPYVTVLIAVFSTWAASQGAYKLQKAARK